MLVLSGLTIDSGYLTRILPAECLLGLGIGWVFVPAFNVATLGVDAREVGVASATVNTAQQVGGSVGTALLNTIAAGATASYLVSQPLTRAVRAAGLVHGYAVATVWGAGILVAAAVLSGVLINTGKPVARATPPPAEGDRATGARSTPPARSRQLARDRHMRYVPTQDVRPKSTSLVSTVAAVRPGAVW
jgi:hypothetical protein